MNPLHPQTAVFVTSANAMEPGGGGVQRCTREYLSLARSAGWTVHPLVYDFDRRPLVRLRRLLMPRPFQNLIPRDTLARTITRARETGASWIFLNEVEAGPLARPLAEILRPSGVRLAILSHGADSTDFIHQARTRAAVRGLDRIHDGDALKLGRQLAVELEMHSAVDAVFCLSELDREVARWLGAPRATVIPRVIDSFPLDWKPVAGRLGTVSTLVHAPNIEGIEATAASIDASGRKDIRFRLVGGPPEAGNNLANRYRCIDYLGPLDDAAFAAEASTWCAFLNPIHCFARGCSTKLAVPLGWQIPIATTRAGARGYVWDESLVPLLDGPEAFAAEALGLADPAVAAILRPGVQQLAARSPAPGTLVSLFNDTLSYPIKPQ